MTRRHERLARLANLRVIRRHMPRISRPAFG
jgi:hypothetical protein